MQALPKPQTTVLGCLALHSRTVSASTAPAPRLLAFTATLGHTAAAGAAGSTAQHRVRCWAGHLGATRTFSSAHPRPAAVEAATAATSLAAATAVVGPVRQRFQQGTVSLSPRWPCCCGPSPSQRGPPGTRSASVAAAAASTVASDGSVASTLAASTLRATAAVRAGNRPGAAFRSGTGRAAQGGESLTTVAAAAAAAAVATPASEAVAVTRAAAPPAPSVAAVTAATAAGNRRSPLVFVGGGGLIASSSPSMAATAKADAVVAAAAAAATAEAAADVGGASSGVAWPPPMERLAVVAERLRAQPRVQHEPVSSRAAAVLVGLFEDSSGVVRVLLTQRSSRLKSHRGEVCLPGGKRDEEDADDDATALREAQEELGLDPSRATVLCRLPPVLSKHHLSVTPVLALLPSDTTPRPSPSEVDAAFTVPLAVFLGTYEDPRAQAAAAAVAGAEPSAAVPGQQEGEDGGDGHGRRTRRRRGGGAVAAAATDAAAPQPLSWRPEAVAGSGAATAGSSMGRTVGEDTVYGTALHEYRDITWSDHQYRIHSFQYGGFDVWGLTATICIAAAQLALGRAPSFQERCPGGQHYSCFYYDGTTLRVRPEAEAVMVAAGGALGTGEYVAGSPAAVAAAKAAPPVAGASGAAGAGTAQPGMQEEEEGEGEMRLPSAEEVEAAPDVAVEAVEEEVVIGGSGSV